MIHNLMKYKKDFQVDEQCHRLAITTGHTYQNLLDAKIKIQNKAVRLGIDITEDDIEALLTHLNY